MVEHSDDELLDLYRRTATRERAFECIIRKHQRRLYAHIRRIVIDHDDADDVVQDVFIKAWKGLESFRADSQLFTWLYRIATNEALSFLRKKQRRPFVLSAHDAENPALATGPETKHLDGDDIQRRLQQAIRLLPEKQRAVFSMKYFDEMKYEEMSALLGTSVGALKASYHFAVKKIEEKLRE